MKRVTIQNIFKHRFWDLGHFEKEKEKEKRSKMRSDLEKTKVKLEDFGYNYEIWKIFKKKLKTKALFWKKVIFFDIKKKPNFGYLKGKAKI